MKKPAHSPFRFKQFQVAHDRCAMKVGTDGVLLGAWCAAPDPGRILDVGTGTGVIALMMAQRYPQAAITAIEIDAAAAEQALANFGESPWSHRLNCLQTSLQDYVQTKPEAFELVVCNPPFFAAGRHLAPAGEARKLARSSKQLTLLELFEGSALLLAPAGRLGLILPEDMQTEALNTAAGAGLYASRLTRVFPKVGKPCHRILMEFEKGKQMAVASDAITIQASDRRNDFTGAYRALTGEFYLKL